MQLIFKGDYEQLDLDMSVATTLNENRGNNLYNESQYHLFAKYA